MVLCAGLDIESTGVDVEQDRIVEIGLVVMELETGEEKVRFERLVNPGINIPPKVVAIHGISNGDVATAQPFKTVAPGFAALLERVDLVIAHNGESFDFPLMVNELVRAGVSLKRFPTAFDTMLQSRWATDNGKVPSLGELCYALDVPYDPALAHGAAYDVACMLACFRQGWRLGHYIIPNLQPAIAA